MMKWICIVALCVAAASALPHRPVMSRRGPNVVLGPVVETKRSAIAEPRSAFLDKLDDSFLVAKREECSTEDIYGCVAWVQAGYCTLAVYQAFMTANCPAACGICTAPPPAPPSALAVNTTACLNIHNTKRDLHQGLIPDHSMTWDATVAAAAEAWALHLANNEVNSTNITLTHSDPQGQYGENLYVMAQSGDTTGTCTGATNAWYAEISDYNWEDYTASTGVIGHFTQVVWKASTQLGVGMAKYKYGGITKTYVVARYVPAGNVAAQSYYDANVPALKTK